MTIGEQMIWPALYFIEKRKSIEKRLMMMANYFKDMKK